MGRRHARVAWSVVALGSALALALGLALAGCGSAGSSGAAPRAGSGGAPSGTRAPASPVAPDESTLLGSAKAVASALTSANAGAGGGTGARACAAFTPAEVAAFVGAELAAPQVNGPLGTQCQWIAADPADQDSTATVQVVGADYWERHSDDPVPGVSGESFVGPALGGWEAGAQDGTTQVVYVSVTGPKASKDTVTQFLVLAMSRL